MRTALKWYLIVGATLMIGIAFAWFTTPAISDAALILEVICKWFGKFYSAESVILACGFIANIGKRKQKPNMKRKAPRKNPRALATTEPKGDAT